MPRPDTLAFQTYQALRADLMQLAEEKNQQRLLLVELQKRESELIADLVRMAEKIFPKVVEEAGNKDPGASKPSEGARVITYGKRGRGTSSLVDVPAGAVVIENVTQDAAAALAHVARRKRTCGICHEPGHRRATCPRAATEKMVKKRVARRKEK